MKVMTSAQVSVPSPAQASEALHFMNVPRVELNSLHAVKGALVRR